MTGLDSFDHTLQTTNEWLKEIMNEAGWDNRRRAYQALRAVLHALRDRLPVDEVAQFGSELPLLVRGIYYEGWNPSGNHLKERDKEEFLFHISEAFQQTDPDIDAEMAFKCVLAVLARRVSDGEMRDVKNMLPKEVQELWPEAVH